MSQPFSPFNKEKFIGDLAQLVAFETVTGQPKGFDEAMRFIKDQLDPRAHVELLHNKDTHIFLAGNALTKTPDICYLVHVDVVAAKPPQFTMEVQDGKAIGRGVSDMKFSIPVGYEALNELIRTNADLSFVLAITSDEERGGFAGAQYLADEYGLNPGLVIVPDGGDYFNIVNKSKGVCQVRVSRDGKSAHSSRPWEGDSAIEPLVRLAAMLSEKYGENNRTEGWHTTMNIGTITGGTLVNQVPDQAGMGIDFRFPPEDETVESLAAYVQAEAQRIDPELKVEVTATGAATLVDLDEPALQLFMRIMEEQLGREIQVEGGYGSTDARHFNKNGIPFIMTKPDGGDIHQDTEHIDIDSVGIFYTMVGQFLTQYSPENRV